MDVGASPRSSGSANGAVVVNATEAIKAVDAATKAVDNAITGVTLRELLRFKLYLMNNLRTAGVGQRSTLPSLPDASCKWVGGGGFGDVYKVVHPDGDSTGFCVKVYKHQGTVQSLTSDLDWAFELITKKVLPNVVPILGVSLQNGVRAAVMPICGTDLGAAIKNKCKPTKSMLMGAVRGLAQMRGVGLEYIDLKPANVLYNPETGEVVIGDVDGVRPFGEWEVSFSAITVSYRPAVGFVQGLSGRLHSLSGNMAMKHKPEIGLFALALVAIELALSFQPVVMTPNCLRQLDSDAAHILMLWILCSMMGPEMTQRILGYYLTESKEPLQSHEERAVVDECYELLYVGATATLRNRGREADADELERFMNGRVHTFAELIADVEASDFPDDDTRRYYLYVIDAILDKDVTDPRKLLGMLSTKNTSRRPTVGKRGREGNGSVNQIRLDNPPLGGVKVPHLDYLDLLSQ